MAGRFGAHRKVPKQITIVGDIFEGKKSIGEAESQLVILENQMRFQGLTQSWRTVKPRPGVVIECWSCFSLQGVKITILGGERKAGKRPPLCWCNCNFSTGVVLSYYYEEVGGLNEDIERVYHYPDPHIKYVVAVCHRDRYVIYDWCQPTDFTEIIVEPDDPEEPSLGESKGICLVCLYDDTNELMGNCRDGNVSGACGPTARIKNRTNMSPYRIMPIFPALSRWIEGQS